MKEHPNLAKNSLANSAQGRVTAARLWQELGNKLNAIGPPIKNANAWKKVFADQKYQAKKKLVANKASRMKTGGGPGEEKVVTQVEELIIQASGLEASVEGLSGVLSFGNKTIEDSPTSAEEQIKSEATDDNEELQYEPQKKKIKSSNLDPKLLLLEKNLKAANKTQQNLDEKLDKLVKIHERQLQIKEDKYKKFLEQHQKCIELYNINIELKTLQLQALRAAK